MSKLQEIITNKKTELTSFKPSNTKRGTGIQWLDFDQFVVIAEIKPKSPAAGVLRSSIDYPKLAKSFNNTGAAAISILTDKKYFGGHIDNLKAVKQTVDIPILRKDFIIDPIQVEETYQSGADIILLIVKCLDDELLKKLLLKSIEKGLQLLVEVYEKEEVERLISILSTINFSENQIIIGVNNRNLDTFEIDIKHSEEVFPFLPKDIPLISLSSILTVEDINYLKNIGYDGVLIGEGLVRNPNLISQFR